MPSRPLDPDTTLSITLGATISRNKYTSDPAPVIAELRALAGDRTDLLAVEVGRWIGYYEDTRGVGIIAAALREMTDLDLAPWIKLGQQRRAAGQYTTRGFHPSERGGAGDASAE